jgi:hypothetical protein
MLELEFSVILVIIGVVYFYLGIKWNEKSSEENGEKKKGGYAFVFIIY